MFGSGNAALSITYALLRSPSDRLEFYLSVVPPLAWLPDHARTQVAGGQVSEAGLVQHLQRVGPAQGEVVPTGGTGNALEQVRVQPGDHRLVVLIGHVGAVTLVIPHADALALRGADSDRENAQAGASGLGGGILGAAFQVLAIRQEHHDLVRVLAFLEGAQRGIDGLADVGATLRDDAGLECVERTRCRRA